MADLPLPKQFGRYRIIRRLGQGGMGSVYLAEDTQLGRRVALKVPHFGPGDGPEARERFFREARTAATLDHPSLCPVHDVGEVDGRLYLTMAFIEGKPLAEAIPAGGVPPRQAAALVRRLALGLEEAHARGVVHRDLKPANVMLKVTSRGQEPVIVDFGLAHRADPSEVRVTRSGQMLGTLGYMAPEQIRGDPKAIGPACDIYALGVILYELLTGELPFQGTGLAVAGQILTQDPVSPGKLRPGVDPVLESICLKAMARKVEDRHVSMGPLAAQLGEFLRPGSVSVSVSRPVLPPEDGGTSWLRPALAGLAIAGVVLVLALIVAGMTGRLALPGRDRDGVIVLEGVPEGAEVLLDGVAVAVQRRAGDGLGEIRIPPGRGTLEVRKRGYAPFTEEVTLDTGERERVRVRLVPVSADAEEITNTIEMKLVRIPAGEFLMGSPDSDNEATPDEKPQHSVRITRPFYLGVHEVTQGQYRAITGANPSYFKGSDELPVEQVSWEEAVAFCTALTKRERGSLGGAIYRLPTEAEWEYACRAGSRRRFGFGDDVSRLGDVAWYSSNSDRKTHPVGQKRPNAFGLYDMHGNVWEWCGDWFDASYYRQSPGADPPGPSQAANRVTRGGGWASHPRHARSANRIRMIPGPRLDSLGFRVARVQPGP
jgi:formylglycine-generating enzyme required for sulfatase activity